MVDNISISPGTGKAPPSLMSSVAAILGKDKPNQADIVIVLKARRRQHRKATEPLPATAQLIEVRSNTYGQIYAGLRETFNISTTAREEFALQEAADALRKVLQSHEPVELTPQNAYIRRLQHELAAKYNIRSYSVGHDPRRRVRFAP